MSGAMLPDVKHQTCQSVDEISCAIFAGLHSLPWCIRLLMLQSLGVSLLAPPEHLAVTDALEQLDVDGASEALKTPPGLGLYIDVHCGVHKSTCIM